MAKAGRVPGIRPKQSLGENGQRVIEKRLEEFLSWRHSLVDPHQVQALHDMRIAAKRLRYALEIFEICFTDARPLLKEITKVQDDLGEIHDLDVLDGLLRHRLSAREIPLGDRAIEIAIGASSRAEQMNRLRAMLYGESRDVHRLGLLGLIGDYALERKSRYESFQRRWSKRGVDEFAHDVRVAIGLEDAASDDAVDVALTDDEADSTVA